MLIISFLITIVFIAAVAYLLVNKYYPQAVLLLAGILMLIISFLMGKEIPQTIDPSGNQTLDFFVLISETFMKNGGGIGMKIMTIGGFVAYMKYIGASNSLVYLALKPLKLFSKYPYLLASLVIPLGQFLFICIPSAAGLGLLLMASVFPTLIKLGVPALSATSVITACTIFGIGPASAISEKASSIIGINSVEYFLNDQLKLVIPLTISISIIYFFVNKYFDKKQGLKPQITAKEELKLSAPLSYAILPILPLILLIIFSEFLQIFSPPIVINTSTAMILSCIVALLFEFVYKKNKKDVLASYKVFLTGMGNFFTSVVTLIVSASLFAYGLEALGFIDSLVVFSQSIGLNSTFITVLMAIIIFFASMLMGSGNASFFSFGPLVPKIISQIGGNKSNMILNMQIAASMGRATSPIAGVVIACSELAEISNFDLAKRNLIPLISGLILMFVFNFLI